MLKRLATNFDMEPEKAFISIKSRYNFLRSSVVLFPLKQNAVVNMQLIDLVCDRLSAHNNSMVTSDTDSNLSGSGYVLFEFGTYPTTYKCSFASEQQCCFSCLLSYPL